MAKVLKMSLEKTMKLLADSLLEQIKHIERKRLNGENDIVSLYCVLTTTLAMKQITLDKEEKRKIRALWSLHCYNYMNVAYMTTEKPIRKEDIEVWEKKVKSKYYSKKKLAEIELVKIANRYFPIITSMLEPFAEIKKIEVAEETIGDDIIGVLE